MEDNFQSCTISILNTISNRSQRTRFFGTCGQEYKLLNFLRLYYENLNSNPYLFGLLLLVGLPYLLYFLRHLCEQHIAHLIPELACKLGMNTNLSAVILVSFVISFNNFLYIFHSEETDHRIECLESGFILISVFVSITCVIPFCILRSSELKIRVKNLSMIIELGMIFLALIYICFYSFLGYFGSWVPAYNRRYIEIYSLCLVPAVYVLYIVVSLIQNRKEQHFSDENLTLTDIFLPVVPNDNLINVTRLLWFELWPPQKPFLQNLIIFPVKIVYILTLPYESNPLILFCSQYVVIFCGLSVMFYITFALLEYPLYLAPVASFSIVLVLFALKFVRRFKKHESLVINLLCFAISSSFNYLCIQLLKDLALFIGFQLQYGQL